MAGFFITFEGGEGTGKSTQAALLADRLQAEGQNIVCTREPGGTPYAEKIRELLVRDDARGLTPMAETLLFFAARHIHVEQLIKPALEKNSIVICDRFTDSTIAYQSYGHGMDRMSVESLARTVLGDFLPDLTLILDIDPEIGLKRAGARLSRAGSSEDRFEKMDMNFHKRLRAGFIDISARNPQRCIMIQADKDIDELAASIFNLVKERLDHVSI